MYYSTDVIFEWFVMLAFVITTIFCAVELTKATKIVHKLSSMSSVSSSPDLTRYTSERDSTSQSLRSKGDRTRLVFYWLLFIALSARLILLLFEGYLMHYDEDDQECDVGCTIVRTVPDLAFASAFLHLVLFYANLVETASGSSHVASDATKLIFHPKFFGYSNVIIYICYLVLFLIRNRLKLITYEQYVSYVNVLLAVVYGMLTLGIAYFGPSLIQILKPSLHQRSSLAFRLVSMCFICLIMFPFRAIVFYSRATTGFIPFTTIDSFYNDNKAFLMLECTPAFLILLLMRQSKDAFKGNERSFYRQYSSGNIRRNYSGSGISIGTSSKSGLLGKVSSENASAYGAV